MTPLVFLFVFFVSAWAQAADISAKAIAVDGDTLLIEGATIELWGIDAPELTQICQKNGVDWPCGLVAKDHLSKFIENQILTCKEKPASGHSHSRSKCAVGSLDIGAEMIEVGLALPERPVSETYYIRSYKEARGLGRGIHAGQYLAPWDWRRKNKKQ